MTLALALTGCGGPPAPPAPLPGGPSFHELADRLGERATLALVADGRLEPSDSLYAADAEVIAFGARRTAPPRFAGVEPGGLVAVGTSRVEVGAGLAWALVEYRWVATGRDLIREGRATLVFSRQPDGGWRIIHAHSSLIP